jgi:hypothetical protein
MSLPLPSQLTITHVFKCIKLGEDDHNRHLENSKYQQILQSKKKKVPLPVPRLKNAFSAPEMGR